jgi:hypothetical protein
MVATELSPTAVVAKQLAKQRTHDAESFGPLCGVDRIKRSYASSLVQHLPTRLWNVTR